MGEIYKIAILEVTEHSDYECYTPVMKSYTDWEEVDEKTLDTLQRWAVERNRKRKTRYGSYVDPETIILIKPSEFTVRTAIADYKVLMKADIEAEEKREEKAKKAAATRKKNKEEKLRKQYEELKQQFED